MVFVEVTSFSTLLGKAVLSASIEAMNGRKHPLAGKKTTEFTTPRRLATRALKQRFFFFFLTSLLSLSSF